MADMYLQKKNDKKFDKDKWAAAPEKRQSAYEKTKMQIRCAVTAQLISAFVSLHR